MPPAAAADYKEGQVWRYKTRPGEENSRLYIVKIEEAKVGDRIYHISLDGLHIANPRAASGFIETISHLPVAETTLDQSVTDLIGMTTDLPDIGEGYRIWREAFDKGRAGVFNIGVAEIVAAMEDIASRPQ